MPAQQVFFSMDVLLYVVADRTNEATEHAALGRITGRDEVMAEMAGEQDGEEEPPARPGQDKVGTTASACGRRR